MTITDELTGRIKLKINSNLVKAQDTGGVTGEDYLAISEILSISDGSSSDEATGWFSSEFAATTGGITVSLADSADPLGGAGDNYPTSDPEGTKLKAIYIKNEDSTNYITLGLGSNPIANWLGTTIRIPAGSIFFQYLPAGIDALNDGVDDELLFTADTASCDVTLMYMFG